MKYPLVSQRITEILLEKNMRAQDLANASGVNKASISQYVNGTNCPSSLTAKKLAEALGVSPMWLMGLDYDREGKPNKKEAPIVDYDYETKFGKFVIEARKMDPLRLDEVLRIIEALNGGDKK